MGPLSDRYGRKYFLLLTLLGPGIGSRLLHSVILRLHSPGMLLFHVDTDYLENTDGLLRRRFDSRASVLLSPFL